MLKHSPLVELFKHSFAKLQLRFMPRLLMMASFLIPWIPAFLEDLGASFFFLTKSSKPWFPSLEKSARQKDTLKRWRGVEGCGFSSDERQQNNQVKRLDIGVLLTPKQVLYPEDGGESLR